MGKFQITKNENPLKIQRFLLHFINAEEET